MSMTMTDARRYEAAIDAARQIERWADNRGPDRRRDRIGRALERLASEFQEHARPSDLAARAIIALCAAWQAAIKLTRWTNSPPERRTRQHDRPASGYESRVIGEVVQKHRRKPRVRRLPPLRQVNHRARKGIT